MKKNIVAILGALCFGALVWKTQAQTAQPARPQWEYQVTGDFNHLVNLGIDGWELTAVVSIPVVNSGAATTYQTAFYLKRPKR